MTQRPPKPDQSNPGEQPRSKTPQAPVKPLHAWNPAPWEAHEAAAIQALFAGTASPQQQQAAVRWILEGACSYTDWAYRPGPEGDRDTIMCLGRQFVGHQIVKLSRLNLELFRKR